MGTMFALVNSALIITSRRHWPVILSMDCFFRGAAPLPFGKQIRPVKDLIEYLLHGIMPAELLPAG